MRNLLIINESFWILLKTALNKILMRTMKFLFKHQWLRNAFSDGKMKNSKSLITQNLKLFLIKMRNGLVKIIIFHILYKVLRQMIPGVIQILRLYFLLSRRFRYKKMDMKIYRFILKIIIDFNMKERKL